MDTAVLEKLVERGALFSYPLKCYYLFSKTGFTEGAREYSDHHGISLISFEEMNDFNATV